MIRTMSIPAEVDGPRDFENEVREILETVRDACAGLIDAANMSSGGRMIGKATDLQKALEIPSTLAWQVFRVANAREPLEEAESVPGLKAVRRLVRAARDKGISDAPLDALLHSIARFEDLVQVHAGSRKTFDLMVVGLNNEPDAQTDLAYRRTAFQANSHIWGTQLRTKLVTMIFHPTEGDDDRSDALVITGSVELCRLRGNMPYELSNTAATDDRPTRPGDRIVALGQPLHAGDAKVPGSTLLTDFSSQPSLNIRNYIDRDGRLVVELAPADVGRQHAVTAFVAELYRSLACRYRTDEEPTISSSEFVRTPTETLLIDIAVAEGTFGRRSLSPYAYMVRHLRREPILLNEIPQRHVRDVLARPAVVQLGRGSHVLKTSDVPRYPEMFDYAIKQVGWSGAQFDMYRCRIDYPVLPSSVAVGFDLPEKSELEAASA